jgi:hypothetical protein
MAASVWVKIERLRGDSGGVAAAGASPLLLLPITPGLKEKSERRPGWPPTRPQIRDRSSEPGRRAVRFAGRVRFSSSAFSAMSGVLLV